MILLLILAAFIGLVSADPAASFCFTNGDRIADTQNSHSFFECRDNRWIRQFCMTNYQFNPETGFCFFAPTPRPTTTPPRTPHPRVCFPGSRTVYLFDNTKYKECTWDGRGYVTRYCQPGAIYNDHLQMCVDVEPTTRWPSTTTQRPTPPSTTPFYGACTESTGQAQYKPDLYNCKNFYQCASGLWTQRSCGEGTIWNQAILTCDHNRGQCRPLEHPTAYPPTVPPPVPTYYPDVIEVKKKKQV
ncbi:unnamed protein product [Caenorhabditis sp. 36 PRJEB53466]|nr:unnamed protein product [Caenorhabditis sp. 36 PRJEB53466]